MAKRTTARNVGAEIGDGKLTLSNAEPIIIDPASLGSGPADDNGTGDSGSADGDEPVKRGRGRPPGGGRTAAGNSTSKKKAPLDLDGVSAILLSTHQMLAAFTKVPEIALDKMEADVLGRGIANVARHYDVTGASAKTIDWFNLFQGLAMVYGPRVFVLSQKRKSRQRAEQENNGHQNGGYQPQEFNGVPFQ